MSEDVYEGTIDWEQYWADADEADRESATPSSHHARELLAAFFAERAVPDSFADVGCGPGTVAFDVAENHSETDVVGYDAAESILTENRKRVESENVENVHFERGVLPDFDPDRQFDVVFCHGTLCYVRESKRAVQRLYDAVEPDGTLVVGYTNDLAAAHYNSVVDDPPEGEDGEPAVDPERYAERFQLVLEGESTLSYDDIHDALGTWPRSFWSVVDKPEERWAWRNHPLVWVPK